MAQQILGHIGRSIGGAWGGTLGRVLGSSIDRTVVNSLLPARQVGQRLDGLRLNQATDGAAMPIIFGRGRVAGTLIWTTAIKEHKQTKKATKNSPKQESFSYSISFALGLCEGPIDGIGRLWADGQLLSQSGLNMRLYKGSETQMPDALIEAVEGHAPAYRGLAYLVFEDFDLSAFGNRLPNISVEVFHKPSVGSSGISEKITSVCLIPGAGEFSLSPFAVDTLTGLTSASSETHHTQEGPSDFMVSLGQLQTQLPHVNHINLIVSWFGTDLRAGHCAIVPGVESRTKETAPISWAVAGFDRQSAHLISEVEGRLSYGGTPSDQTVVSAIQVLKSLGYSVTLVPFILMDIPHQNGLPDPYGASEQSAYPWRGRISCDTAPNLAGTGDKTAQIDADIAAFVGTCQAADFAVSDENVHYFGPQETTFSRFVLHMAALSKAAGGVESLLLGSELRGLTTLRNAVGHYPFVAALKSLAAEVKTITGTSTKVSYGADWSEYFGHHPNDGSGDVRFHLDTLWSDSHIDFIGLDWYAPASDWREGTDHLDALAGFKSPYDQAYIGANLRGGENYDFYYQDETARAAQSRTPIVDTAYGEDWVFRPKDIRNWWSHAHFERINGVRQSSPTDWVAQSKPIRFIEYGCAAIDKGANAPNLFLDPKSSESAIPPFSNGERDDQAQRAYLNAFYDHYQYTEHNPISAEYGGAMVEKLSVWAWDARPFPAFPARADIWGDFGNWRTGHWLNGRVSASEMGALIGYIAAKSGLDSADFDIDYGVRALESYTIEGPQTVASALSPLLLYADLTLGERGGKLSFFQAEHADIIDIGPDDLAETSEAPLWQKQFIEAAPAQLNVRCYDLDHDYQVMSLTLRDDDSEGPQTQGYEFTFGLTQAQGQLLGQKILSHIGRQDDSLKVAVHDGILWRAEVGDRVRLPDQSLWIINTIDRDESPTLGLLPYVPPYGLSDFEPKSQIDDPAAMTSRVRQLEMVDVRPLGYENSVTAPLVAAVATDHRGVELYVGASSTSLRYVDTIEDGWGFGTVLSQPKSQRLSHLLKADSMEIALEGATLSSVSFEALQAGENKIFVQSMAGLWEVIQFQYATLIAPQTYRLTGLIRGQWGSEEAAKAGFVVGARVIVAPPSASRLPTGLELLKLSQMWRGAVRGSGEIADKSLDKTLVFEGFALKPRAPVHLKWQGLVGQDRTLRFKRRGLMGAQNLEVEPPYGETQSLYRISLYEGDALIRTQEITNDAFFYGAAQQSVDFPSGLTSNSRISVAQKSNLVGFGSEAFVAMV